MRNVAFSILLFALAVVQIAVVSAEMRQSHVRVAAVAEQNKSDARVVFASSETEHQRAAY